MKRFQFNLEGLLRLRRHEETVALNAYAEAVSALEAARSELQSLQHRLTHEWHAYQQELHATNDLSSAARRRDGWAFYEQAIETQEQKVLEAEKLVHERGAALLEAKKQRETIDRFRERLLAEHREALEREEQKLMDELAPLALLSGSTG